MEVNSYKLAEKINEEVNNSITYKTDIENYGKPEFWEATDKYGDCEDYALVKRGKLLSAGWPIDKMGLVCCNIPNQGGHCVLYVETDKGGFIMDNRFSGMRDPTALDYEWISILRGSVWYAINGWS